MSVLRSARVRATRLTAIVAAITVMLSSLVLVTATPASAAIVAETPVPLGSLWAYLDDGSDQGVAWYSPAFDDDAWSVGPAELGYGDGGEATVVSFGGDPNNRPATTYFRHSIDLANVHELTNNSLRVLRDDAAIVYINGTEVWRSSNLPAQVDYQTFATGNATENRYDEISFDGEVLVEGPNVFAVEIHNRGAANADISFDLEWTTDRDDSIPFPGPPMQPDSIALGAGEPASGNVADNDDPNITYSVDAADLPDPASVGTITFDATGAWTWTPVPGFSGNVIVPHTGCDNADPNFCGSRNLVITVQLPSAVDDAVEAPANTQVTGNVGDNDDSRGNGALTWSLVSPAPDPGVEGTLLFANDGNWSFTPNQAWSGSLSLDYQACDAQNDCGTATLTITIASPANIVINEIYFHPPCTVNYTPCEDAPTEFIELHNPEAEAADLSGFVFTDGIDYEFPDNTTIAAGGYLVLADDAAGFQSAFGFAPAGEWAGKLSNNGERIALASQFGQPLDEVRYSDGAATPGAWSVQADGEGDSMQLTDASADNNVSYYWIPASPTPRAANASGSLTPSAENFAWNLLPASNEPVTVTADVYGANGAAVTLDYRINYPGSTQTVAMTTNDGVSYTGQVPASAYSAGDLVRFRIEVGGTTIAPRSDDTVNWVGTTVANPAVNSNIPVFEWFTSTSNYNAGYNEQGTTLHNGVIAHDGVVYDNIGFRIRGAIARSSSWTKRNWKFKTPDHHAFEIEGISYGLDSMDLQGGFADEARIREVMGHTMADQMGLTASQVQHVRIELNGEFFGLHTLQEHPEGGFLKDNDMPNATLYKHVNGTYEGGPNVSSNTTIGWEVWDIPDYINLVSAASIIQNNDFAHGNFYWWYDEDEHERFEGMVWDMDLSQGIRYAPDQGLTVALEAGSTWSYVWHRWKNQAPIFNQALSGDLRRMYLRRLRTLADEWYGTGRLETLSRETFDEIRPDWRLDTARWGFWGGQNYSEQGAIDRYADQWIDQYYAHIRNGGPNGDIPGPQPANPNLSLVIEADPGDQRNEHIQIVNNENTEIDISEWRLVGAVDMEIPAGSVLRRNNSAYVVDNDRKDGFRAVTNNLHVLGEYGIELPDGGGEVFLIDGDGNVQAQQQWGDVPTPGLILNEWNAVSSGQTIPNGDTRLGNVLGNGGDWFELAVVEDHLDVRGWELEIWSEGERDATIDFSNNPVWADLRVGTIITISEGDVVAEDGTVYGEDVSFDPATADWWIHVVGGDGGSGQYITATNYKVNNDDWQLIINDGTGLRRFGPAGEGVGSLANGGVENTQIGELEADPTDQIRPQSPYGNGDQSTFGQPNGFAGTLQDFDALRGVVTPPTDVTNLTADQAQREIVLTWDESIDDVAVTGYEITRDGAVIATVTELTYTDSGLTPDTAYAYSVVALDGNGNRSAAADLTVSTLPLIAPDTPPNFDAAVGGPDSITLSWDEANDDVEVVSYELSRDGVVLATLDAAARSYDDTGLVDGQTYDYSLVAIDSDDLRSVPATIVAATRELIAPSVPGNLVADAADTIDTIVLTWEEATDDLGVDSYEITRDGEVVAEVGADVLIWTDTGLADGTAYAYQVRSVDTDGLESDPAEVTGTTRALQAPSALPNLSGRNNGTIDSIQLDWGPATDDRTVVSYEISRDGVVVDTVNGDTTTWTDTGLVGGTTYVYSVIAIDDDGLRGPATEVSSATRTPVPPTPASNFRANVVGTSVQLSWFAASDDIAVTGYELSRDGTLVATLPADARSYTDAGLEPETSHAWSLVTLDGDGERSAPASTFATTGQPSSVVVTQACLSENGRFDIEITNSTAESADFVVSVTGLPDRTRTVAAGGTDVVTVTGRSDGIYDIEVRTSGELVGAETMTVSCDPPPSEVDIAVSCLAQNGRLDVTLLNMTDTARVYEVTFGSLAPRLRTVGPDQSTRVTVTGRQDGPMDVVVTADGTEVASETATIACDPQVEVALRNTCMAGNGRLDVDLKNISGSSAVYAVTVGSLAPRTRTIAAGAASTVTVTGRPDRDYPVTVTRDAVEIWSETATVACDGPPPPSGDEEVAITSACLAGNGRVDIHLHNDSGAAVTYTVQFGSMSARSRTVAANGSDRVTITGRADGDHEVTVSRDGDEIHSETITVACDG